MLYGFAIVYASLEPFSPWLPPPPGTPFFLFGPPAIGFLSDRVGFQHGITLAGLLLAAAFFLASATAPLPVPAHVLDA